jgi:hypothetical protein
MYTREHVVDGSTGMLGRTGKRGWLAVGGRASSMWVQQDHQCMHEVGAGSKNNTRLLMQTGKLLASRLIGRRHVMCHHNRQAGANATWSALFAHSGVNGHVRGMD